MNVYLLSVLLGIIEGLTEFLPVSSTAHLRIAEEMLARYAHAQLSLADPYWKMYTIVIQLGAILSLFAYFWKRILALTTSFPSGRNGSKTWMTHPLSLTAVAFCFTAIPSFLLIKVIGKNLESLRVMAASLIIGGIVMWIVDAYYARPQTSSGTGDAASSRITSMDDTSLPQAIWVGCCQIASAVFPGTSRSMSTIAAGQVAGMSRSAALEFSFFVSIPTMVAATGYELLKSIVGDDGAIGAGPGDARQWVVLAIGFVVSFIVAYAVVAWFMNWVRTRGFVPFAIYRIVFGLVVLVWALRA